VRRPSLPRRSLRWIACSWPSIGLASLLLATLQQLQLRKKLKSVYPLSRLPAGEIMAAFISLLGILALIAVILRQ
jgi:hypothetical protein